MPRRRLAEIALRLLGAWALLSAAGYFWGRELLAPLLPAFSFVIALVQADFVPALDIAGSGGEAMLRMSARVVREIALPAGLHVPVLARIDYTSTHVFHALVPAVLLLAALAAWPATGRREALLRVVIGSAGLAIVMALTTPLFLAGRFQMWMGDMVASTGGARPGNSWLVDWALFTEGGGRWLIPLAVAAVCVMLAQAAARRLERGAKPAAESQRGNGCVPKDGRR
jgi:hypothetical protein